MKKISFAALAAIVLAITLTSCKNTTEISNPSSESTTTVNQSSSTEPAESTEPTESTESAPESSEGDSDNIDDPNAGADNSALAYPDNKAGRIVKAILAENAWSYMDLADADTLPFLIPDLSLDDCDEYCIAYCGMSAQLQYAIAVKPKAGSEEKVENALATFYENVKNNPDIPFYAAVEASANGAVMDTTDDGYICVIVHENGKTIADVVDNVQ